MFHQHLLVSWCRTFVAGVTKWVVKSLTIGIQLLSKSRYRVESTICSGEGMWSANVPGGWNREGVTEAVLSEFA